MELWEIGVTVGGFALALFFGWMTRQGWVGAAEREAIMSLEAFTQRIKDKLLVDIAAAKDPASDGGSTITSAEKSLIRQRVWEMALMELKGPALRYVKSRGEKFVKGLIGKFLDKKVDESTDVAEALDGEKKVDVSLEAKMAVEGAA